MVPIELITAVPISCRTRCLFPRRAVTVCLAVHLLLFQISTYVNTDQYRNLLACRFRRLPSWAISFPDLTSAACGPYNHPAIDKFKCGATQKLFAEPCELTIATDCHCNWDGTRRFAVYVPNIRGRLVPCSQCVVVAMRQMSGGNYRSSLCRAGAIQPTCPLP